MIIMNSIASIYDKFASQYAEYLEERLPQFLLTKFISMIPKNAQVLDAGCAAGRDSVYLAEEGLKVSGIDISREILKIAACDAKEAGLNIDFRESGLGSIPYDDKKFDGIWCMDTLNHISKADLEDVLREFYRLLKQDGVLFISAVQGDKEGMIKMEYLGEEVFFACHNQVDIEDKLENIGFKITESSFEETDDKIHVNIFAKKI